MTTQRDELARDVFTADNSRLTEAEAHTEWAEWIKGGVDPKQDYAFVIADGLITKGYRKPRTITTVAEIDALPVGSVIRGDDGRLWEWERVGYGGVEKSLSAMGIGSMLALWTFRGFPATVLYEATA